MGSRAAIGGTVRRAGWVMFAETPVFKREEFVAIFEGDESAVRVVLYGFLSSCAEFCAALEEAVRIGDRDALRFLAHKLKGSAANARASRLSEAAAALERLVVENPASSPMEGVAAVRENYLLVRSTLLALYPEAEE